MNSQESNTLTVIKYFKNNYIKMIIFILLSLILTGSLTHKYYKDNELYFSKVIIRFNESFEGIDNYETPHYDVLYFLENENIENIRLILNPQSSNTIEIEIPHKSVDDKNNDDLQKLLAIMEDYKKKIIVRLNQSVDILEKRMNDRISQLTDKKEIKSYYSEIEILLAKKEAFIEHINKEEIYKIFYDGKINIKKAKRQMAKNLVISFMISIILIILSLWIVLFIREIKKNS